jgi:hypothetical protein
MSNNSPSSYFDHQSFRAPKPSFILPGDHGALAEFSFLSRITENVPVVYYHAVDATS